jgi:iron-sulfur cluster assembly protein
VSSITVTEKAATALKKHKEGAQAGPEMFLRVKLIAGGCSGHEHRLFLDNKYDEGQDSKYNFHGEDVVVDKKSELYLEGATLDFIEGLEQSGFHLAVPMAKKTCGCGSSYQF